MNELPQALDKDQGRTADLRIFEIAALHLVGVMRGSVAGPAPALSRGSAISPIRL
jgi:hypothetical protein